MEDIICCQQEETECDRTEKEDETQKPENNSNFELTKKCLKEK